MTKTQFGEWRVSVEHPSRGRCAATVVKATVESDWQYVNARCSRSGAYGWGDELYCCQHHPDWHQWLAESGRVNAIAEKAFRSAMRSEETR